jgi:SAM-dependent methyltransferase
MNTQELQVENFWNQIYSKNTSHFADENDEVLSAALNHFGNIQGKRILDIGCGDGRSSLYFAMKGANVIALDISEVAINNLNEFCKANNINNLQAIKISAFEIENLGQFDFIFGNLILHHLEPFDDFSSTLRQVITSNGKAFFHENNAFSNLLIWFRNNLVGKYGIPKYGDDDEFPLMPKEVDMLRKHFSIKVEYPELVFFGLISVYLLKGRFHQPLLNLDNYLYKYPKFRKYSYRQYLLLQAQN